MTSRDEGGDETDLTSTYVRSKEASTREDSDESAFAELLNFVADAPSGVPTLPAGTQIGEFVVERILGRGGAAVVYLARDERLNRAVALKVAKGRGADDTERLLEEARTLARLAHPNVVTVHEVEALGEGTQIVIAMEFVDGGTLRDWMKRAPRTTKEILGKLAEAGQGLLAAHREGLVHRDFKPENVLVGKEDRVRVSDFGLARSLSDGPGFDARQAGDQALVMVSQWAIVTK